MRRGRKEEEEEEEEEEEPNVFPPLFLALPGRASPRNGGGNYVLAMAAAGSQRLRMSGEELSVLDLYSRACELRWFRLVYRHGTVVEKLDCYPCPFNNSIHHSIFTPHNQLQQRFSQSRFRVCPPRSAFRLLCLPRSCKPLCPPRFWLRRLLARDCGAGPTEGARRGVRGEKRKGLHGAHRIPR